MKTDRHWKLIGFQPHHGIALPLFSLRTQTSCGVGEFLDLIPLIDWCKALGLDCIQLLPLNDTGYDSSPYNPLSSCALDPLYLSLPGKAGHFTGSLSKQQVKAKKLELLRSEFKPQNSDRFVQKHPWVKTYALFMALKEHFGQKAWSEWPESYQSPRPEHFKEHSKAIDFHCHLQSLCFEQMEQVHAHATKQGTHLIGDISLLLNPDSADVWAERPLFRLGYSAGSPPDAYNPAGQKWGFPLFDWEAMQKENFAWWRRRLHTIEPLFHIYRIDHVVGLFRIWGIPLDHPEEAHFFPSDRSLWASLGREHLTTLIESTSLLPVAEDLGTIPDEVYPILKELGICGTKVVRWQRDKEGRYLPWNQYEPFSITTLGTHDLPTLENWWEHLPAESVPFAAFKGWSYHPILRPEQRLELLRDVHHTPSYFHINLLQEYLALFPELAWPDSKDERINVPGTLLPTNWAYRFRPSLEEITAHEGLKEAFKKILA